jgi:hypothetical protein
MKSELNLEPFSSKLAVEAEVVKLHDFYIIGEVPTWQPLGEAEHDHWLTWGN